MIKQMSWLRDFTWGVILATLLATPVGVWYLNQPPLPYTDVQLVSANYVEGEKQPTLELVLNFIKNDDCVYHSLGTFGLHQGEWERLPWEDLDVPQGDRLAGDQTLSISITYLDETDPIEIRTRHFCDGVKVDTTMFVYDRTNNE